LGLTGANATISQTETSRSSLWAFDLPANSHTNVRPTAVYVQNGAPVADANIGGGHATQVAGVMISTHGVNLSVASGAPLHSSAYVTGGSVVNAYEHALISMQHVATRNAGDVRAQNLSWGKGLRVGVITDGNSLLTQGLDWSAAQHNILYAIGGNQGAGQELPTDSFNGITVVYSQAVGGIFRQVNPGNTIAQDATGARRSNDIMAPGTAINMPVPGGGHAAASGTSFATPHVTGTVSLLQEFGDARIAAGDDGWDVDTRDFRLMKAVLMNSVDKILDAGDGLRLGMEKNIIDTPAGAQWTASDAFTDTFIPLDDQMGTGQLNANRALIQFRAGEFDSFGAAADIPVIGWDKGLTVGAADTNKYAFDRPLVKDSYVSLTLAWERKVSLNDTVTINGQYDNGESFTVNGLTDMDLYLMPADATDVADFVCASRSVVDSVEHIFCKVPETGDYEIWVNQFNAPVGNQNYGLAWWAVGVKDFGDADPQHPTKRADNGARHDETRMEWLGQPLVAHDDSVSSEADAIDPRDPDAVPNLREDISGWDLDRYDDAVLFFPLTYMPGDRTGKAQFNVCVEDVGDRYDPADADKTLYLNAWVDWDTDFDWEEANSEHIIDGLRLAPKDMSSWGPLGLRAGDTEVTQIATSADGRCGVYEALFDVGTIGTGELWARFRLDYGEDVGRNDPRPLFRSEASLRNPTLTQGTPQAPGMNLGFTRGNALFGEVEDYLIGSDFGDAPDPDYPTLKASDGARHLDFNREWLGPFGTYASATREVDGCDMTSAEEDGIPNLGPGCDDSNEDLKEDGSSVPPVVLPEQLINVVIDVAAKIDSFGYANRGPGGENSAGIPTLQPDCTLAAIPDDPDTPLVHRDRGRYAAWDPQRRLYLNVWADWNANEVWEAGELVVSAPLDPEDWDGNGIYTLGEPFSDDDMNGVRTADESFTDVAGVTERTISCPVTVPEDVALGEEFWWRFRLDYGENVVLDDTVVHHATEGGRTLAGPLGGALWGEVEDHPMISNLWIFIGTPLGGDIDFTISGVALHVATVFGESTADAAANVAAAINDDATLQGMGIVAVADGNRVATNGSEDSFTEDDPGLHHYPPKSRWQGSLTLAFDGLPLIQSTGQVLAGVNDSAGFGHLTTLSLDRGLAHQSSVTLTTHPSLLTVAVTHELGSGRIRSISGGPPLASGTLPVPGSLRLCFLVPGCGVAATAPLTTSGTAGIGIGGILTVLGGTTSFPVRLSIQGAPWTPQTAMVPNVRTSLGGFTTLTWTGTAHGPVSSTSSTAAIGGQLRLVSPINITAVGAGSAHFSGYAILDLTFVEVVFAPEPGRFLMLGTVVVALLILGRRRAKR
jgi:hypothetical protein